MIAPAGLLAALIGAVITAGLVLAVAALRGYQLPARRPHSRRGWARRVETVLNGGRRGGMSRREQLVRVGVAVALGVGLWLATGWPVAGVATVGILVGLPWLLGSATVVADQIDRLEAVETWCRRMADTLSGGGSIGLVQCLVTNAAHAPEPIADEARLLARRMQGPRRDEAAALRAWADAIDDPVGDQVAGALILALDQQGAGVSRVLRQLADGVAREVSARRAVEAERAEPRQSMRMLLIIQAGILLLLTLVPNFAEPYRTATGQVVMGLLLAGTVGLLVWMRRLAIGQPAPRFLRSTGGEAS